MAGTGTADKFLESARVVEVGGQIVELQRSVYVTGLAAGSGTLEEALNNSSNVPVSGDEHPDASPTNALADMLVEERTAIALSPKTARVDLTYRWNPSTLRILHAGAAAESVVSEREGPNATDPPIVLEHPHSGRSTDQVRKQGAQVAVTVARTAMIGVVSLALTGREAQAVRHINRFKNKINSDNFMSGTDAGQWKVVSADYTVVAGDALGATRAKFTFGFQHKLEGWNPVTVVATRSDGRPYPDTDTNPNSKKDIDWFEEEVFGSISSITS